MKYRCKTCGKGFDIPAIITHSYYPTISPTIKLPKVANFLWPSYEGTVPPTNVTYNYTISVPCCPHCYSTDIEENKSSILDKYQKLPPQPLKNGLEAEA